MPRGRTAVGTRLTKASTPTCVSVGHLCSSQKGEQPWLRRDQTRVKVSVVRYGSGMVAAPLLGRGAAGLSSVRGGQRLLTVAVPVQVSTAVARARGQTKCGLLCWRHESWRESCWGDGAAPADTSPHLGSASHDFGNFSLLWYPSSVGCLARFWHAMPHLEQATYPSCLATLSILGV